MTWPKTDASPAQGLSYELDARDLNEVLEGAYSLLAFPGIDPTGVTDSTAGMALALAYCAGKKLYCPQGTYLLTPTQSEATALQVSAGTKIIGAGYDTVFKMRPITLIDAGQPGSGRVQLFMVNGSNTAFKNFRFDGNSGAFDRTGLTIINMVPFFRGINGPLDNILFEDIWAHDLLGINNESFVASWHRASTAVLTGAVTNLTYRRCRGWNIEGTPFHINGTIDDTSGGATWDSGANCFMTDGALMEDCECWDNEWQGISVYGAKNVRVQNSRFYNNGGSGMNTEWSKDVFFLNNTSVGNCRRGLSIYGRTGLIRVQGNNLKGNNTRLNPDGTLFSDQNADHYGEITVVPAAWWKGSPIPKGSAGTVEIINNRVEPLTGLTHLRVVRDTTGLTIGEPFADSIVIEQDDIADWVISTYGAPGHDHYPNVTHRGGPSTLSTIATGRLIDWTATAGMALAAYAGTGNKSPGAVTATTNTQFANILGKGALLPGRSYRIRTRIKLGDANAEWKLIVKEDAGSNQTTYCTYQAVTTPVTQVDLWKTLDVVVTINPTWLNCHIQWLRQSVAGTSSDLHIDYVNVEELSSQAGLSEAVAWAGRLVGRGTAAPTTGTWKVGDRWENDSAALSGNVGWVCTTAGTPGTWSEYGHISTDTNQPSFANVTATGGAGTVRDFILNTSSGGGSGGTHNGRRWVMRCSSDVESGGSNTGSKFQLNCYDDDGAFLFTAIEGLRATGYLNFKRGTFRTPNVITQAATMTPNSAASDLQTISLTTNAVYAMGVPTNATVGQTLKIVFTNAIGGVSGAGSWDAVYKLNAAWGTLADTKIRVIEFYCNGTSWIEISRSADL